MDDKMALYRECCFTNCKKIMVKKVTFVGLVEGDRPNCPHTGSTPGGSIPCFISGMFQKTCLSTETHFSLAASP